SSGYKGVYFDKTKRRWRARITKDKIVTALGYFDTAEKAAAAYAKASAELHGEYGRLR
ncbi:AP2 domain-containing protein, partial [Klebsiella pneumoniae]|uniref:AP2 domain-containing protein n=1 Tax=Klebsiella pneumoniae TaxID=573 RepID=UPI003C6D3D4E